MTRQATSFWPLCAQGTAVIFTTLVGSHWLNNHTTFGIAASVGIAFAAGLGLGYAAIAVINGIFHTYADGDKGKTPFATVTVVIALAALVVTAISFFTP